MKNNSDSKAKKPKFKFTLWIKGKKKKIYIIDNLNTNLISSKFNQMKCILKEKVGFQP